MKRAWIETYKIAAAILLLFIAGHRLVSQTVDDPSQAFQKIVAMIPMRDGVKLNTEIFIPKNSSEALPILLNRTPYGWPEGRDGIARTLRTDYKELASDGYIFALQDIRGRFRSEGQFVMLRPPRDKSDPNTIDESTDAYDTIDWLIKNVPRNNGRVGMLGVSYDAWLTVMALLDPHPALKAVSEQASPADMFLGDDFHHNGAFRLSYAFEYAALMESSSRQTVPFSFDRYDTYDWYLRLGGLANANKTYFHNALPTWNDFVDHPNYDAFWRKYALTTYLNQITVPNLNVAGWWDPENFYGPLKIYELLEKHDAHHLNYLVVGPWNHGGWYGSDGSELGAIHFEIPTAKYFREKIQVPWFAHFLKDKGKLQQPEARIFETGQNRWVSYDNWPPRNNVTETNLYFQDSGQLSFTAPPGSGDDQRDSYLSDPAHPVPYRHRPIQPTYQANGSGWPDWLVEDQRFVQDRSDVLTWQTDTLSADITVSGDIIAHLYASTTSTDSDWIVKLIDVYPENYPSDPPMGGYQLMITGDVLRGRFRQGFEKPEPIVPNQINQYVIELHSNDHVFLKGHRIMVQVQSTWFPVIDRNPQTFVENIFKAADSNYISAMQSVFRSAKFPSHITLTLANR